MSASARARAGAGGVEPRPAGARWRGRRAEDAHIGEGATAGRDRCGDLAHRRGGERVAIGEDRLAIELRQRRRHARGESLGVARRHDREHEIRVGDERDIVIDRHHAGFAARASRLASLRPLSEVRTAAPRECSRWPTAAPISPCATTTIVNAMLASLVICRSLA